MGTFVHLLVYGISHKVIADVDLNIHHSRTYCQIFGC
jgi:hypothetical protein